MITDITTQKVYTFPDRVLYGEFCATGMLKLRLRIVKGEIEEPLCIIDSNDRAFVFDKYGVIEEYSPEYIGSISNALLRELLNNKFQKILSKK